MEYCSTGGYPTGCCPPRRALSSAFNHVADSAAYRNYKHNTTIPSSTSAMHYFVAVQPTSVPATSRKQCQEDYKCCGTEAGIVSDNIAAHPGDSEDYVAYVVDKLVMSIESPHLCSIQLPLPVMNLAEDKMDVDGIYTLMLINYLMRNIEVTVQMPSGRPWASPITSSARGRASPGIGSQKSLPRDCSVAVPHRPQIMYRYLARHPTRYRVDTPDFRPLGGDQLSRIHF